MEKASPPLALVPPPGEPGQPSADAGAQPDDDARAQPDDDARDSAPHAAEAESPPETLARTVTIQGSPVPWGGPPLAVPDAPAVAKAVAGTIALPSPADPRAEVPRNPTPVVGSSPVGVPPAGPHPFRVGPYEVATRIARGAMGSVYVCRNAADVSSGRLLTLKVVRQHALKKELAIASFQHEALIGSYFRHANAQTVIDQGIFEDQPFLVLDYVDGGCLADLLAPETRPNPAVTVAVVLDLLAALGALHATTGRDGSPLGLVHCDISPENVLVGVDGAARLADFGSARITAVGEEAHPFSVSKPPWMPPEQFTGDRLDASSDLYAVGVLLWTALTGHQPFAGDGYDQTAMNVMRKKIPPPSTFGAPVCLDDVCMQAMSRFRDRRFLMAAGMATALRTAASAENLVAPRLEVGQWVQRAMGDDLAQRRRVIAAMFGGGADGPRRTENRTPGGADRPRVSAAAEKTLSAKTIFMPAVASAPPAPPPAAEDEERPIRSFNLAAVFWVSVSLILTLAAGMTVSSWLTRRSRQGQRDAVSAPAAPPAVQAPTPPVPSVSP